MVLVFILKMNKNKNFVKKTTVPNVTKMRSRKKNMFIVIIQNKTNSFIGPDYKSSKWSFSY